ncbi:MAG: DUF5666 domain-containing protein [Minisyncoccia bacterium]
MAKTITADKQVLYWNVSALVVVMCALSALFTTGTAHAESGSGKNSIQAGTGLPAQAGIEVQIGAQGNALVRGAQVTSVSGSEINANTSLGSSVLSWIVKTDSNTDFTANKGGAEGIANIAVGDTISFRGAIDQTVSGLRVNARQVKDWTSVESKAKLEGVVSSINSTLASFTISHKNGTTTVQTSGSTSFKDGGGNASFADIVLNAKVKLQGLLNASSSVFTATSVQIGDDDNDRWSNEDGKKWRDWVKSKVWLKFGFND